MCAKSPFYYACIISLLLCPHNLHVILLLLPGTEVIVKKNCFVKGLLIVRNFPSTHEFYCHNNKSNKTNNNLTTVASRFANETLIGHKETQCKQQQKKDPQQHHQQQREQLQQYNLVVTSS